MVCGVMETGGAELRACSVLCPAARGGSKEGDMPYLLTMKVGKWEKPRKYRVSWALLDTRISRVVCIPV